MMTEEKFTEIVGQLVDLHERFAAYRRRECDDRGTEEALIVDFGSLVQAAVDLSNPSTVVAELQPTQIDRAAEMLRADPSRSDRDIARAAGCSPTTAGKIRRELDLVQADRFVERGGQRYSMRVGDAPLPNGNDQRAIFEAFDRSHAPPPREPALEQPTHTERVFARGAQPARASKVFYLDDC